MIVEKRLCTGCFACINKCPKQCIHMEEDKNGCIYPVIDESKCIHCNLCKKVCPSIHETNFSYPKKCYAMYGKDENLIEKSTSGGVATILSNYILKKNGVVYGAAFQNKEEGLVNHIRIDRKKDLQKLQGSKYVHSYIGKTFQSVKKDLENDKLVLFVGTPCQIAGLQNFLEKSYENLYTIDLICHGVPSQKYLQEEIANLTDKKVDQISFRSKDGYVLRLYENDNLILQVGQKDSIYYYGFLQSLFCRENCYHCLYAKPERCSDITIGDFWGLDKNSDIFKKSKNGISVVLPITKKGENIIQQCIDCFEYEERMPEEAIKGNTQLRSPSVKPRNYDKLAKIYHKGGMIKLKKKIFSRRDLKEKIKKNKIIYYIYKSTKRK